MPKKSLSPEAAQKRVWTAEIKQLEKTRRKVTKDFDVEEKRLYRESNAATKRLSAHLARRGKQEPRALGEIDRRINILKGRIGN